MDIDRASVTIYASNLLLSLLGFVGTAYFAQTLGGTVLGIFFTFDAVMSVVETATRLGVDTGIEKRMSEAGQERRGAYLTAGYLITLVPICIVGILLFLFSDWVTAYIGVAIVPLLIVLIISSTGRWLIGAALRGEGDVARASVIELIGEAVRVATSVALIAVGYEIFALLYGVLVGILFKFVVFYLSLSSDIVWPTRETIRDLWGFSKYTSFNSVSSLAYNWADTLVLAYFASKTAVAVYEASWKVSVVAVMASQALSRAVFPSISEWASRDEYGRIDHTTDIYQLGAVLYRALTGAPPFDTVEEIERRVCETQPSPPTERSPDLQVFATDVSVDVLPPGITKRSGLQWLTDSLDVEMDEVAYIGDTGSDLEALRAVGTSFAPANANEAVRDAVDYVTDGAVLDGTLEAYRYCLHANAS